MDYIVNKVDRSCSIIQISIYNGDSPKRITGPHIYRVMSSSPFTSSRDLISHIREHHFMTPLLDEPVGCGDPLLSDPADVFRRRNAPRFMKEVQVSNLGFEIVVMISVINVLFEAGETAIERIVSDLITVAVGGALFVTA